MYVLYGQIKIFLPHSSSLKDKRQTIQSIITRIRKRFSVSICEVNHQDFWQRADLGFAAACSNYMNTEVIMNSIRDTLDQYADVCEITDLVWEVINT